APFALGYVRVDPLGYVYPTLTKSLNPGIDLMTKHYNGQFYIFATTRNSESDTNISATFKLADESAEKATVVNENLTIPIKNGTFSGSFERAWTGHIYQIK